MTASTWNKVLRREVLIPVLRAAVDSGEYRFARQTALSWLAAFPGDLEVTLLQAQAILPGGRAAGVLPAVELVCRKDPFYLDAYRVLADAAAIQAEPVRHSFAITSMSALGVEVTCKFDAWGEPLRRAFTAAGRGSWADADAAVQEAIHLAPDLLLPAALHLLVTRALRDAQSTYHLAQIYHQRWPDCLSISLVLAEAHLEMGSEPEAVRLLHACAASDAAGQVARRLWGENHPYRSLWPEDMVILFEESVPAAVAGRLGWNSLIAGDPLIAGSLLLEGGSQEPAEAMISPVAIEPPAAPTPQPEPVMPFPAAVKPLDEGPIAELDADTAPLPDPELDAVLDANSAAKNVPAATPAPVKTDRKRKSAPKDDTTKKVESEFAKLAHHLNRPNLGRADGRFPVYVILTSREGLCNQYGPQTASVLDVELRRLGGLVSHKHGWGSAVFYPDDASCTAQFGLTPVNPRDPWKIKLALAELDAALGKRGERIGALLIVGGDPVVPFHRLPNPTDDSDGEIPSDSPYATLDANYFVPEWPVGRLPGEAGADAGLLLEQLRQIVRYHGKRNRAGTVLGLDWLAWVQRKLRGMLPSRTIPNFGYTAAVWRRSSLAVFRPIGAPHTVLASPPEQSGSFKPERITGRFGYYNLHGLEDSPSWYGQRDPLENHDCPDYPVAISPCDLKRNSHAPRVVFSEACYGGHVFGKRENESLALKFLSMGTLGVVASTCISYGSLNTPLIAADLLGHLFWQHIQSGRTAGEALMQAKIDLVREMNKRQGYLDAEDQKTLIAFVLYGDPLAGYGLKALRKGFPRSKDHMAVAAVSDGEEESPSRIPADVLVQVKGIVAEYLPGTGLDDIHFSRVQTPAGSAPQAKKAAGGRKSAKTGAGPENRLVVTVSKQVKFAQHIHHHYLRVTLDEGGKTLKLSISR